MTGLATARGFVAGPAFIYRGDGDVPVPEYVIEPGREGDELLRLKRACSETRRDLEGLISSLNDRTERAGVRVFESHLMMLEDPALVGAAERLIIDIDWTGCKNIKELEK